MDNETGGHVTEAAQQDDVDALLDIVLISADELSGFAAIDDEAATAPVALGGTAEDREREQEISYEQFGFEYIRRVLHKDRILGLINELLGPTIQLGPIGAGPGRKAATVSALGTFRPCKGEEIPGPLLSYRVYLPISVVFDIDMRVDKHRFTADVVVPIVLTVHTVAPLRIRIDITVPNDDEVALTLQSDTRRGAVLQKLARLEPELRRFLVKVVRTELSKPYVRRATDFDMADLIDEAWPGIAAVILPRGPEDRLA
ncbi:hypothetical protein F0U44_20925 [Nocardioides humilatus]|uniref:Uncharacterized protein n=1 Tax=Nocardioides humilatus TaxID=2607660 RepID=A0A5B1L4M8_9ACTN|nr:hypothetical protein [Nocardioides humilatus]KAA1415454.1 hypothetical protein F0U44_20925 [Nocardioides humilatus]